MPLPLIPIALLLTGVTSGGGGLALGTKGALDAKRAHDEVEKSKKRYARGRARLEGRVAEVNVALTGLSSAQREAIELVVVRMADWLRRHERQVRECERLLVDELTANAGSVSWSSTLGPDAITWVRDVVAAVGVGGGTAAGVTGAVTTFGAASTGTAIAGLSGAAAESATLAFLGGGSLASGGGGVALGATALNVVTAGPALLVGGFAVSKHGAKALTKAAAYETKVSVALAEMKSTRTQLDAVDTRAGELKILLERLVARGTAALDHLESEPFDPALHAEHFQRAMSFAVAVRDVAATPVVDQDGDLNEEAATIVVTYRPMAEEDDE